MKNPQAVEAVEKLARSLNEHQLTQLYILVRNFDDQEFREAAYDMVEKDMCQRLARHRLA